MPYSTLLDSGATLPQLMASDLENLGVSLDSYPAQTILEFSTVAGLTETRCYELHVELLTERNESLVDADDPVHPQFSPNIGAILPVSMFGDGAVWSEDNATNNKVSRLSGVLPFVAAYVSSAPGNSVMIFGEDRNDVLGHAKMPPARNHMKDRTPYMRDKAKWEFLGDPLITFTHLHGAFVDYDLQKGVSTATMYTGVEVEHSELTDPGNRLQRGVQPDEQQSSDLIEL